MRGRNTAFALALLCALGWSLPAFSQVESDYRLGPGDRVQIQVSSRPDLSGEAVINGEGALILPVIGQIRASDRTPEDLAQYLRGRYNILDPAVTEVIVNVLEFNSRRITVVGEVRKPGPYTFREIPGVWEVLLGAGGETPAADMTRVQVVRKDPQEGEARTVDIDLSRGIARVAEGSLPVLRSGDTVIVPALSATALHGDQFQVLGQVSRPGRYQLAESMTVVEAIAVAGGTLPGAKLGEVRLTRPGDKGVTVYELDVNKYLKEGRPQADYTLRAGDTITIPSRTFSETLLRYAPFLTSVAALLVAVSL